MKDLTKTKEKEHMVTNRLTLNRQEERGCPETVVAPTVHLLLPSSWPDISVLQEAKNHFADVCRSKARRQRIHSVKQARN